DPRLRVGLTFNLVVCMYSFQPLGDQAVLASCPDETAALRLAAALRPAAAPGLLDVGQAYMTGAAFVGADQMPYGGAAEKGGDCSEAAEPAGFTEGELHVIQCCYEFQLDLAAVAKHAGLSADEVIALHAGTVYTVYAIGFCPGFPYLGYLPPALCGVPRLP